MPKKFKKWVNQEICWKKYFHWLDLQSVEWNKQKKEQHLKQPGVQMQFEMVYSMEYCE